MGSDIHMVVERKVDDCWIAVHTMEGFTNQANEYSYKLARVRNYEPVNANSRA